MVCRCPPGVGGVVCSSLSGVGAGPVVFHHKRGCGLQLSVRSGGGACCCLSGVRAWSVIFHENRRCGLQMSVRIRDVACSCLSGLGVWPLSGNCAFSIFGRYFCIRWACDGRLCLRLVAIGCYASCDAQPSKSNSVGCGTWLWTPCRRSGEVFLLDSHQTLQHERSQNGRD